MTATCNVQKTSQGSLHVSTTMTCTAATQMAHLASTDYWPPTKHPTMEKVNAQRQQSPLGLQPTTDFICRICYYIASDVKDFRKHYNNHMPEASIHRSIPSSPPPSAQTTSLLSSATTNLQLQGNKAGPVSRDHSMSTTLVVQDVSQIAQRRTEEQNNASIRPSIEQLERPIPLIVNLDADDDVDAGGSPTMDVSLHL
ncbi:hypothetical protein Ancab_013085 [Ancistrocladus abbreviatus]